MNKVLVWFARSPIAEALKVAIGAGLVWVLTNVDSLHLSPIAEPIIIAIVTLLINALNPHDTRYGKKGNHVIK